MERTTTTERKRELSAWEIGHHGTPTFVWGAWNCVGNLCSLILDRTIIGYVCDQEPEPMICLRSWAILMPSQSSPGALCCVFGRVLPPWFNFLQCLLQNLAILIPYRPPLAPNRHNLSQVKREPPFIPEYHLATEEFEGQAPLEWSQKLFENKLLSRCSRCCSCWANVKVVHELSNPALPQPNQ